MFVVSISFFFFFKQKTAYEIGVRLVGSEMCIRDSRLIHKPTGVVVSCQTQRSQFQNRDYAMEMLKAKLYQIAQQQHMDKIEDIKGVQNEIAWGHQIRSYVFMPYTMVKDHRTNYETGNVDAVMDGDLDGFIFAYLKAASRGELQDT